MSTALSFVIAMVFIYLLLSVLCSTLVELVAGFLKLRAGVLEVGLQNLFGETAEDLGFVKKLYAHSLIQGLVQPPLNLLLKPLKAEAVKVQARPSYIPSRTFALALLHVIGFHKALADLRDQIGRLTAQDVVPAALEGTPPTPAAFQARLMTVVDAVEKQAPSSLAALQDLVAGGIVVGDRRQALDACVARLELPLARDGAQLLDLREMIAGAKFLPDRARQALLALADRADKTLDDVLAEIERWFDDGMDRVSGWYRRYAQALSLVVAVVVAVSLNADSFTMGSVLLNNSNVRNAMNAAAAAVAPAPTATPGAVHAAPAVPSLASLVGAVGTQEQLPFGPRWLGTWLPVSPQGRRELVLHVLGLLVTAVAISFGAPFWFDLLNKLVNFRLAGPPPERSTSTSPPPS